MEKHEKTSKGTPETREPSAPPDQKPWEEPKLAFVEPKLTRHGDLEKITGRKRNRDSFFGEFSV